MKTITELANQIAKQAQELKATLEEANLDISVGDSDHFKSTPIKSDEELRNDLVNDNEELFMKHFDSLNLGYTKDQYEVGFENWFTELTLDEALNIKKLYE